MQKFFVSEFNSKANRKYRALPIIVNALFELFSSLFRLCQNSEVFFFIYPMIIKKLIARLIICQLTASPIFCATMSPKTAHSTVYEDIRAGKKIPYDPILLKPETSSVKCALACTKHEKCRSFNFCEDKTCELNRDDVYSTQEGEGILTESGSCSYFGIKREKAPICLNRGKFVSILKETDRGRCEIFRKRVDREWAPWVPSETIDSETEWKMMTSRIILTDVAHGGKQGSDDAEKVTWLKFVRESQTWVQARIHCIQLGGKLFDDVNGTVEQLEFLRDKLGNLNFWLGISRDPTNRQIWRNMDGEKVDTEKLAWNANEPTDTGGTEDYIACSNWDKGLFDIPGSSVCASICDMT